MLFRDWLLSEDIKTNIFEQIISDMIAEKAVMGMRNFLNESLRFHKPGRGDDFSNPDADDAEETDSSESPSSETDPSEEDMGGVSKADLSRDLRNSVLWIRWDAMVRRRELIQQVQKMCELHKEQHPEEFNEIKSKGITESTDDDIDFSSMDDADFSSIEKPSSLASSSSSKTPSSNFDIEKAYQLLEKLGYIEPAKFEKEMRNKTSQERRMAILEIMHKASKETGNDPPADISEEEMYGVDQEKVQQIEAKLAPLRKKITELLKNEPKDKKEKEQWKVLVDELKAQIKTLAIDLESTKKSKVEMAKQKLEDILSRVYKREYEWHASELNQRNSAFFKGDDNRRKSGHKTFDSPQSVMSSHIEDIIDSLTTRDWRKPAGKPAKLMDWGELHEKFPELGTKGKADLSSEDWIDGVSRKDEPGNTKGIIAAYRSRLSRTVDKEEHEQRKSISPSAAKRSSISHISEKKDVINLDINSVQMALTGKDPGLKQRKKRSYLSTPDNPYGSLEFYMDYLEKYNRYVKDRSSVSPDWATYFDEVQSGVEDIEAEFPSDLDESSKIRKKIMEDIVQHQSQHSHIISLDPSPESVMSTLVNFKTNLLHVSKSPIVVSSDLTSDKATKGVWQSGRPSGAIDRPHDLPAGIEAERNETHRILKTAIYEALNSLRQVSKEAALAICIKWGIPGDPRHNAITSDAISALDNLIGARGLDGSPAKAGRDTNAKCKIEKQSADSTLLSLPQDFKFFSRLSVGNDVLCSGCRKGTEIADIDHQSKFVTVSPAIGGMEGMSLDVKFTSVDCIDRLKNLSAPYPQSQDPDTKAIDRPVRAISIDDVAEEFMRITGEEYSGQTIRNYIDRGLKYICTFISNYDPISSTHARRPQPEDDDAIAQHAKQSAKTLGAKPIAMSRPAMTGAKSPLMSRIKKAQPEPTPEEEELT